MTTTIKPQRTNFQRPQHMQNIDNYDIVYNPDRERIWNT